MSWWLSVAFAARWLVGVQQGAVDLDADLDGRVDGGDATYVCYRSSRVCVVDGAFPEPVSERVRYVEADRPMQRLQGTTLAPCPATDAVDEVGYELARVGIPEGAWEVGRGAGAVVAVQDAGFRTSHVDLAGRVVRGWDYGDGDGRPEVSPAGVPEHGTFVAGIVAAVEDGSGRVGAAPEAELFLQKIADSDGALFFSYAIAAMDDLATTAPEVRVVDYSIASLDPPQAFQDAVAALGDADVLLVTAAANCSVPNCAGADNDANPVFPANYALTMDHVLAVASQRPDGSLDPYSHFGASSVALGAPGADVCSLGVVSDAAYVRASGTSYAAPLVAGVAALARNAFPRLTAGQTEALLCATSDGAELAGQVRCGAVDADRALHAAWPDAVTGDGVDAPVELEVGADTLVEVVIDNLAGAEEVTVALAGAGLSAPAVGVELAADGPTTVSLSVRAAGPGALEGELSVLGCCASTSVSWAADALLTIEPRDTGPTSTPEPTSTTGDTGSEEGRTVEPAAEEGGCGCQAVARPTVSPWFARRRVRTAP